MSDRRWDNWLARLRVIGPYVAIEILLPGGTLVALLIWLAQRVAAVGFGGLHPYVSSPIREQAVIGAKPHHPSPSPEPCLPCEPSPAPRATGAAGAPLCAYRADSTAAAESVDTSHASRSRYPRCAWSLIVSACDFPWRSTITVRPAFDV